MRHVLPRFLDRADGWRPAAIPRVVHQTFPTRDLPEDLARNLAAARAMNPGWDFRLYDDAACAAYIAEAYGADMLRLYHRISPLYGAARADLFRYLLVYREGGMYLDVKSRITRPLDDVLRADDAYVLSNWNYPPDHAYGDYGIHNDLAHLPGGEFQQWHVIAAAGHPFLAAVIDTVTDRIQRYRPWRNGSGKPAVLRITGPIAYTLAIAPLLGRHPHRTVDAERDLGLGYSIRAQQGHVGLFATHYGEQKAPLVRQDGRYALVNAGYQAVRKVYLRAKR
jgi:hypothetical protein